MKARVHRLKSWPPSFGTIVSNFKPFDLRKADRDFRIGDFVELNCYNPELKNFTGEKIFRRIGAMERVEVFDGNRLGGVHVILGYVVDHPGTDIEIVEPV